MTGLSDQELRLKRHTILQSRVLVRSHIKYVIFPLELNQWTSDMAKLWLTVRYFTHKVTWSFKQVGFLSDVTNYRTLSEHQTTQGVNLSIQAVTLKVTWSLDHMANVWSPDHLKNLDLLSLKLSRVATSGRRFRTETPKFLPISCFKSDCCLSCEVLSADVFLSWKFHALFSS